MYFSNIKHGLLYWQSSLQEKLYTSLLASSIKKTGKSWHDDTTTRKTHKHGCDRAYAISCPVRKKHIPSIKATLPLEQTIVYPKIKEICFQSCFFQFLSKNSKILHHYKVFKNYFADQLLNSVTSTIRQPQGGATFLLQLNYSEEQQQIYKPLAVHNFKYAKIRFKSLRQ